MPFQGFLARNAIDAVQWLMAIFRYISCCYRSSAVIGLYRCRPPSCLAWTSCNLRFCTTCLSCGVAISGISTNMRDRCVAHVGID